MTRTHPSKQYHEVRNFRCEGSYFKGTLLFGLRSDWLWNAGIVTIKVVLALWMALLAGTLSFVEADGLAREARNHPPEFAADALLRLAEIADAPAAWKRDLIAESFNIASGALRKIKRSPLPRRARPRSLESYAAELGLDTLTLQSRAVRAMLPLDGKRARAMIENIHVPRNLLFNCEDQSVPDLAEYYRAVLLVSQKGFTRDEMTRELHVRFLEGRLSLIRSPVEVGPAAEALRRASLGDAHFENAALAFSGALGSLPVDDRSFSLAMERDRVFENVEGVLASLAARGIPTEPLAQGFRKFLTSHLRGTRCSDNLEDAGSVIAWRDTFNERFGSAAPPISLDEIQPESTTEVKFREFKPGDDQLILALRKLRLTPPDSADWRQEAQRLMLKIDDFDGGDGPAAEVFHRKLSLWHGLAEIVADRDFKSAALRRAAALISSSDIRTADAPAWFWHAKVLASRLRTMAGMSAELASAGDGLLGFSMRLEQAAPEQSPGCTTGAFCSELRDPDTMRAELLSLLLN